MADQGTADDLFRAAGHSLENVSGQAFVCRVDGLPGTDTESCTRTPPQNAYWGLWWSDGTNGTWTYASQGAYALNVPDGGAVAFSWNGTSTSQKPSVAPPRHEEQTQEPSRPPGRGDGGGDGTTGGSGTGGGSSTTDPSASPSDDPFATDRGDRPRGSGDDRPGQRDRGDGTRDGKGEKPGGEQGDRDGGADEVESSEEASPSSGAPTAADPPASSSQEGLPVWVGTTAVGGVLGMAGLAAYLRRRAA